MSLLTWNQLRENLYKSKNKPMSPAQVEDLFIEWNLYGPRQKEEMMQEFCNKFTGNYTLNGFHNFLKDKLEIEGYWKKVGLM